MVRKKIIEYRVDTNGCHICTSHSLRNGYPTCRKNSKHIKISRKVYEENYGLIPKGLFVMHKCDNKLCINPLHLEIGTPKQNTIDAVDRGLIKYGYSNTGKISGSDVIKIFKCKDTRNNIAKKYDISPTLVTRIKNGKCWKRFLEENGLKPKCNGRPKGKNHYRFKFTPEKIKMILNYYYLHGPKKTLEKHNISRTQLYRIKKNNDERD